MSQQYPYLPNGQQTNPYAQGWSPQGGGFPAGYGQPAFTPGQMMPGQQFPPGMPGIDPSMLAQVQQAMANPNEGDEFEGLLPSPKNALLGALTGAGLAIGFTELEKRKSIDKFVQHVQKIPGVSWLDEKINEKLADIKIDKTGYWSKPGWFQDSVKEMFFTHSLTELGEEMKNAKELGKELGDDAIKAAAQKSVDQMQRRQIEKTLEVFQKYSWSDTRALQDALAAKFKKETTFAALLETIDEEIGNYTGKPDKQNKNVLKALHRLQQRIKGLNEMYLPVYKGQIELSARLQAKEVGPVGRLLANGVNYIKRAFSGETMSMGAVGGFPPLKDLIPGRMRRQIPLNWRTSIELGWNKFTQLAVCKNIRWGWSKLTPHFMPIIAGATFAGMSFQKASKAKDGEKRSTFFHEFLGTGIGNFIGWEFGRKLLNSFQFGNKLLGKRAFKLVTPRFLPAIGGITLGGLVTELVAMFVIGSQFQKVGEGISHLIFGKPSEESLEGKGQKKSAQAQQQQQQMGMNPAMQPSMQRGMGMDDAARREQIQKKLLIAEKFPKRPTTTLTPEMISRNIVAEKQHMYEQSMINSRWDSKNILNPYGDR